MSKKILNITDVGGERVALCNDNKLYKIRFTADHREEEIAMFDGSKTKVHTQGLINGYKLEELKEK